MLRHAALPHGEAVRELSEAVSVESCSPAFVGRQSRWPRAGLLTKVVPRQRRS